MAGTAAQAGMSPAKPSGRAPVLDFAALINLRQLSSFRHRPE
ncbi:hypothetical protein [Microbulbifer halophilus]